MKTMLSLAFGILVFATASAYAGSDTVSAPGMGASPMPASSDMTSGEVRKIDMETKKITLKHDEIKNLGMPSMTMVFHVKDPALLEKVKAGDKVLFSAEKMNGALTVTSIEAVK